jgi:adenylyltransferase/sulfurtransferase
MEGYFHRQIQLNEIGASGQQKLHASSVLVIGAGGLGCPLLLNLASCGVGRITIIDFDKVELHNLHRQPLFTPHDLGRGKSETAARFLLDRFPHCLVNAVDAMFDAKMAVSMVPEADILVDCSDNLQVRYLMDDTARIFEKPWVHASVSKFNIQWALFRPHLGYSYRNVYPVPPNPMFMGQCNTEGILGAVPALAGTLQANVVLNALLGLDEMDGKIFHLDTRSGQTHAFNYGAKSIVVPENAKAITNYNYEAFCQNFKS